MRQKHFFSCIILVALFLCPELSKGVLGYACNWGRVSSEPLAGDIGVQLMKANGFNKVKLFEADPEALKALANSGIQVMVGIPNYLLEPLGNEKVADDWVAQNVSAYVKNGVDVRYVAVSNEPFLKEYQNAYTQSVLPAMKNIKGSLDKAGLGQKVQVTIPLNADICETPSGLPSGADLRADIAKETLSILQFLHENNYPITINIYPFISLASDPYFPKDYAFFDGTKTVVDGDITYTNAFDGNLDTLIVVLKKHDVGSMPIIIGEVGWPTGGHADATNANAKRFYDGLIGRINKNKGPPMRPNDMPDVYMFGLLDENQKSTRPGDFETHWGIFNSDGSLKFQIEIGDGTKLVPASEAKDFKNHSPTPAPAPLDSNPTTPSPAPTSLLTNPAPSPAPISLKTPPSPAPTMLGTSPAPAIDADSNNNAPAPGTEPSLAVETKQPNSVVMLFIVLSLMLMIIL